MPQIVNVKGKVSSSPYEGESPPSTGGQVKSNFPLLAALVILGVAMIIYARAGTPRVGPVLTLTAGDAPDQSTIDNLTNSINALAGQVYVAAPAPTGGASTPLTDTGA